MCLILFTVSFEEASNEIKNIACSLKPNDNNDSLESWERPPKNTTISMFFMSFTYIIFIIVKFRLLY